jgi:molecular chaperone HtpG
MKESLPNVNAVRFTASLGEHPVCLSSEGEVSVEMEKILKKMPGADAMAPKASVVLEINSKHAIADKLKELYENDKEKLAKYAKILYAEACLVSGVSIDNPKELTLLISELMI